MAASGLNDISGFEGRPPYGIATAFPDFTSPYLLAGAVLAAIHERDRTGRGQHVEVNQLSATIGLLGAEWMRFKAEGNLPRNENRSPNYSPHGVYRAAGQDAWIAVAVETADEWRALASMIGRDDLASDEGLCDLGQRRSRADELDRALEDWTARQDKLEAAPRLQGLGIRAAPVQSLADLVDWDPQLRHRNHYQRLRQPSEPDRELVIDGEAIHFAGIERTLERAPALGEHNEYVLRDIVGLTEAEFDSLVVAGVIG
jgi:benzylsuccinate CoA-transferase BbsF subunit